MGSVELLFPAPFAQDSKTFRFSAFYDMGNVVGSREEFSFDQLRASVGLSASWLSPIGPMVFSLGRPVRDQDGDAHETFQFSLGAPL